ncbi:MAG: FtsQ-type POTRA domain-containing protein [Chlorobiaceae bacterium]|nr:FtsQ-type POTRA domain-containing protein [Chlorobiaceae bacterium]
MSPSADQIGRDGDQLQDRGGPGSPKGKALRLLALPPVVTVVLLLLFAGIASLAWQASHWKQNVVASRVVVVGTRLVPKERVVRALAPFGGRKLAELREEDLLKALSAEPYIRDAKISRELNGIVRVAITERQPMAVTLFQGSPMIIDTEGFLLPDNAVSARYHRLPKVYGITGATQAGGGSWRMQEAEKRTLDSMVAAFAQSEYAGIMLREIHIAPGNGSWFLVSGSTVRFILGNDGNFKEKLKKFEIFWQKVIAKKGLDCYESVDLRFRERVFAKDPGVAGSSQAPPVPAPAPAPAPAPPEMPTAVQPSPR